MNSKTTANSPAILVIVYFTMLFYGSRLALEEFFFENELSIVHSMAVAFPSGIIALFPGYKLAKRSRKDQVVVAAILLLVVVVANIMVSYL